MNAERMPLRQAVIVEGKYDKIKLESLVDTLIIPTNGFRIFKDPDMRALIRMLAKTRGIIILTDSDRAGFQIRAHIANFVREGEVINAYIPDLFGKERRKRAPSREGKLGVEGVDVSHLREALKRAGALESFSPGQKGEPVTRLDLYEDGLSGSKNSRTLRLMLLNRLGLPERLSQNALLPVLRCLVTREEYKRIIEDIKNNNS